MIIDSRLASDDDDDDDLDDHDDVTALSLVLFIPFLLPPFLSFLFRLSFSVVPLSPFPSLSMSFFLSFSLALFSSPLPLISHCHPLSNCTFM